MKENENFDSNVTRSIEEEEEEEGITPRPIRSIGRRVFPAHLSPHTSHTFNLVARTH